MDTPLTQQSIWARKRSQFRKLTQSIHFVISKLLAPKSRREDMARREHILNILLFSSIILLGILNAFTVINHLIEQSQYGGISPLVFSIFFLLFIGLFVVSRSGHFIVAAHILLTLYFIATTYAIWRWGIALINPILSYVLIILMAGILISSWAALMATALISGTLITIAYLQVNNIIPVNLAWRAIPPRFSDAFQLALIFFVMMIVTWLSNREIEKSLRRARRSEAQLQRERDLLEVRVEERTKELKKAQAQQISQLHQLAEFGHLTSGFFHDLINPLTAVLLHMEEVKKGTEQGYAAIQHHVDKAFHALKRMENFILNVQKQIKHQDDQSYFSINDEIQQACDVMGYKARKAQVDLVCLPTGPALHTWGNPIKFHQVIVNLINNAIDAYAGITRPVKQVSVTVEHYLDQARVSVTDWGSGIPNEILPRIFDPFFTTKDSSHGVGIGLSTAKNIVEQSLNGTITVTSKPDHGTMFTVTFPLRKNVTTSHEQYPLTTVPTPMP